MLHSDGEIGADPLVYISDTYVTPSVRAHVFQRAAYRCEKCGALPLREDAVHCGLALHHLVKPRDGGLHSPENLQALCRPCHEAEHAAERGRGTRTRPTPQHLVTKSFRFETRDMERLSRLAEKWRCSLAAAVRRAVDLAADRAGF
jgi:hypothetical protein